MYSIVLTDGKIINIRATEVDWIEKSRMIRLINNRQIVARINMDNVVGWIDADYKAEVEPQEADIPTMYYPQVEGITPTVINNGSDMLSAEEIDNLLQALAKGESEEQTE